MPRRGRLTMTRAARLLLPAVIALPLVVMAAGGWLLWSTTWRHAEVEIGRVADAAAEYAQGLLAAHAQFLDSLADRLRGESDAAIAANEPVWHRMLQTAVVARPLTRDAAILGADAVLLASAGSLPVARVGGPEHASLRDVLAAGTPPYGLSPLHATHPGQTGESFSLYRRRDDGPGLVAVSLGAAPLGEGLSRLAAGSGDILTLVHRADASLLARSHGLPEGAPRRAAPGGPIARAIAGWQGPRTVMLRSPFDGEHRLAAIRPVEGWPVLVVAARARSTITARWAESMPPLAILGVLAAAALGLLVRLVHQGQHALAAANAGLERRVGERTAELADRTRELTRNEERLRLATEAARIGIWEVDLRAGVVRRSPLALAIFGYGSEAEVGLYPSWRERIHPQDREQALATINAGLDGEIEEYSVTYRFERPDGRWIWIESHGRVVERDPGTGRPRRLAGTSQDITERKEAEARQTLLAREVDHRAKNALAVVTAALRLTPRHDPEYFASVVEGRVAALARAHALLAKGRWSGAPLRALIEGELTPFLGRGPDGPQATIEGPPLLLHAAAVQSFSMLLHELATNAAKHGALSVQQGRLHISWEVHTAERGGECLHFHWTERGGPALPSPPRRRGFGTSLIEATVQHNLGGETETRWDAEGLSWTARVSLADIVAGTPRPA